MRNSHKSFLLLSQHKPPETWGLWNITMPLGFTVVFQGSFYPLSVFHIDQVGPKKNLPGSSCACDQLVLQKSSCHHCLASPIPGTTQPVAPVSSLALSIRLVGQEHTLKAPSGRDITNARPFKLKFLFKSSFCFSAWTRLHPPARGAFPGHESQVAEPAAQSSATLHCVSIKKPFR